MIGKCEFEVQGRENLRAWYHVLRKMIGRQLFKLYFKKMTYTYISN